jgi:hypothetical protein
MNRNSVVNILSASSSPADELCISAVTNPDKPRVQGCRIVRKDVPTFESSFIRTTTTIPEGRRAP